MPPRPTLDRLRKAAQRAADADAVGASLRAARDRLALDVYEAAALTDTPVTYDQLAEALGKTRDRVSQVLAAERTRRKSLALIP